MNQSWNCAGKFSNKLLHPDNKNRINEIYRISNRRNYWPNILKYESPFKSIFIPVYIIYIACLCIIKAVEEGKCHPEGSLLLFDEKLVLLSERRIPPPLIH